MTGDDFDLAAVLGRGDGGVPHGSLLSDFAETVIANERTALPGLRDRLIEAVGAEGCIDALAVVANFNAIDRVADATGIPLDSSTEKMTVDLRAALELDAWPSRDPARDAG